MFTEMEIEILKKLYQHETAYISFVTNDISEINDLKRKLVSGAIELDGKYIRLTPEGRYCVSEILKNQNVFI